MNAARWKIGVLLALGALAGCSCDDDALGGVEVGFRVSEVGLAPGGELSAEPILDFGRVLEHTRVVRELELVSASRADVTVQVSIAPPFSAPAELTVLAGSTARLPITFHAGSTRELGRVLLGPEDKKVAVALLGVGVRPKDCVATAACRISEYDLASDECVERPSPEGDRCTPANICVENGACRDGVCVGTSRTCDDQNLCTTDGCSATAGCVNAPRQCPVPSNPCKVPTCDPLLGCGEGFAQDGTPCGAVDCVKSHLCISGACAEVDTPDGILCAPPTPCQGEGRCRQKQCVRPDAGEMTPVFSALLSGGPPRVADAPVLVAHGGNLFVELCGLTDGGCELASYTPTGFLRFNRGHGDGAARWVVHASDGGVVVSDGLVLEGFSLGNGTPLWSWMAPDGGAVLPQGTVLLGDGGVAALVRFRRALEDGGVEPEPARLVVLGLDGGAQFERGGLEPELTALVATQDGMLTAWGAGGVVCALGRGEGTVRWVVDAGSSSLATAYGVALAGGSQLIAPDGGVVRIDWGEATPLPRNVLAAQQLGYLFATSCQPPAVPACGAEELQTTVRVLSLFDGQTAWEATVLPARVSGFVEEAALVDLPGGAVATLTTASFDGGAQSHLQLFAGGQRLFVCPLPEAGEVRGAVFDRSALFVVMARGGAHRLEAYNLQGLPLTTADWPQRNGVSASRRER